MKTQLRTHAFAASVLALSALCCDTSLAEASKAQTVTLPAFSNQDTKIRVGSGFGFNSFRGFNATASTQWFFDGDLLANEPSAAELGLGSLVNATLAANANPTATQGDLAVVMIETALRGPVTNSNPVRVFGQAITINADTVLVNLANAAQIAPGQVLSVSGQVDVNNSFLATRVELRSDANMWRLTGFLTSSNASTITVGTQVVARSVPLENCATPLPVNQYLEVRANAIANFAVGQSLTPTRIRCGVPQAPGVIGAPGVRDGLISEVVSDTEFKLGPTQVVHGAQTLFRFGNADDLELGVRVEVEGVFSAANTLSANRIFFTRPQVRFEAPVQVNEVIPNTRLTVLGKTLAITPQTRDVDGIGSNGLSTPRQLRVRGYIDQRGQLFATRIEDRGMPASNRYRAMGPVNDIMTGASFRILGLNVDTSTSLFTDANDLSISSTAFYAALNNGRIATISDASFDFASTTLRGGLVSLEDDEFANRAAFGTVSGATVSGTLTEVILPGEFQNGFE